MAPTPTESRDASYAPRWKLESSCNEYKSAGDALQSFVKVISRSDNAQEAQVAGQRLGERDLQGMPLLVPEARDALGVGLAVGRE